MQLSPSNDVRRMAVGEGNYVRRRRQIKASISRHSAQTACCSRGAQGQGGEQSLFAAPSKSHPQIISLSPFVFAPRSRKIIMRHRRLALGCLNAARRSHAEATATEFRRQHPGKTGPCRISLIAPILAKQFFAASTCCAEE